MFCRNCGNQLPDEAKFCTNCGAQIAPTPASPANEKPAAITVSTPEPVTQSGEKSTAKAPSSKRKVLHIVLAIFLIICFIITIIPSDSGEYLVENDSLYGLAFNMSVEEYMERHNQVLSEYILSQAASEHDQLTNLFNTTGLFLSKDNLEKGNVNADGEDTYIYSYYCEAVDSLVGISFSVYDGNIASVMVAQTVYNEISYTLSRFSIAIMLTIADPTQNSTFEENLEKISDWWDEDLRRTLEGDRSGFFVNGILYTIATSSSDTAFYCVHPMTDEGYQQFLSQLRNS